MNKEIKWNDWKYDSEYLNYFHCNLYGRKEGHTSEILFQVINYNDINSFQLHIYNSKNNSNIKLTGFKTISETEAFAEIFNRHMYS